MAKHYPMYGVVSSHAEPRVDGNNLPEPKLRPQASEWRPTTPPEERLDFDASDSDDGSNGRATICAVSEVATATVVAPAPPAAVAPAVN